MYQMRPDIKDKRGLIHVYTGNGKGKTTASLGMAMRAAGWGWKVLIIQFLKKGDYGEKRFIEAIKQLSNKVIKENKKKIGEVKIESFGKGGFVDPKKLTKRDFIGAEKAMKKWEKEMKSKYWDMIILDEINVAIKFGLISSLLVLELIKNKPKNLELVLTGRWATKEIIKLADYVTEIKEVKHPYKKGNKARKGIEY